MTNTIEIYRGVSGSQYVTWNSLESEPVGITNKTVISVKEFNDIDLPAEINVIDFGAIGDGATDDTQAFQNAINYIQTNFPNTGAELLIPQPIVFYKLTNALTITSNIKITGLGILPRVEQSNQSVNVLNISLTQPSKIYLDNINFVSGNNAIYISGSKLKNGSQFNNLQIETPVTACFNIQTSLGFSSFKNVSTRKGQYGFYVPNLEDDSAVLTFKECQFRRADIDGVYLYNSSSTSFVSYFYECTLEYNKQIALNVKNTNIFVYNTYFEDNCEEATGGPYADVYIVNEDGYPQTNVTLISNYFSTNTGSNQYIPSTTNSQRIHVEGVSASLYVWGGSPGNHTDQYIYVSSACIANVDITGSNWLIDRTL